MFFDIAKSLSETKICFLKRNQLKKHYEQLRIVTRCPQVIDLYFYHIGIKY